MKAFSSDWWLEMRKQALYKFNNYAWHSHYYEIAEFCNERAEKAFWIEAKNKSSTKGIVL